MSVNARLMRRSKPMVVIGLPLRPRPQTEPENAPGSTQDMIGQYAEPRGAVEKRARAFLGARRELGAAHVADHERVPGEDEPRLRRARAVASR